MKVAILGNGDFGTALAVLFRRRGHQVHVWGRKPRVDEIGSVATALQDSECVLFAVASQGLREVCELAKSHLTHKPGLISVIKGIELDSGKRASEVIQEVIHSNRVAVLSGPSFAREIAKGDPTAVVCASPNEDWCRKVQETMSGEDFRVYTSTDMTGVEWGGTLKNVVAIASGVCVGLGLGVNAQAALITRGVAEIARVGTQLGGNPQTFFGLSGMGDLILTCSGSQSRNRRVGEALGRGIKLEEALKSISGTAEGVRSAASLHQIMIQKKCEAPILQEVYALLYEMKSPREAVRALMGRAPKEEF